MLKPYFKIEYNNNKAITRDVSNYVTSITDAIKNEDGKLFIDIKFNFDNLIENIVLSPIQSQLVEKEAIKNILKEYNIGETKITDSNIPFVKN